MAIFMIGTQRSGSNLLRLMMNQLPEIAAPHPPHILERMLPVQHLYGDMTSNIGFRELVNDICTLVELNPVPWKGVSLDRDEIARRCRRRNVLGVYEAVYDVMAEAWAARQWCCKSLANIKYLPEIESHFNEAKYIYLHRDGRDVAMSFKKAVVGEKHVYHIAREWAYTQKLALAMEPSLPPSRFFRVSYEHMISKPEQAMRGLCNFLGVEYNDSMMKFHESEEAQRAATSSSLWNQVAQPIKSENTGKYLSEASEEEIQIFEAVAGDVLQQLGYSLHCDVDRNKALITREQIKLFDRLNEQMKSTVQGAMDDDDRERRDRQAALIRGIIARRNSGGYGVPVIQ